MAGRASPNVSAIGSGGGRGLAERMMHERHTSAAGPAMGGERDVG
jgi:hypothetical protein